MSFTYDLATPSGQVRLLIADTDSTAYIFSDAEVQASLDMTGSGSFYVSGQAAQTGANIQSPPIPLVYSVYRAAGVLLRSLASNKSRLASVAELLDVKLSISSAATALKAQAQDYDDYEANRGQFMVAEWVNDSFSARERWTKTLLRQQA